MDKFCKCRKNVSYVHWILFISTNDTGLITGPALKKFQPRVVAAIGSALSGVGLILSSMSNQLWQIIVAYGLVGKIAHAFISLFPHFFCRIEIETITELISQFCQYWNDAGLGLGFINPSSFIAVNSYFSTKRGRAIGLALAGTYTRTIISAMHICKS